jgi:microcystin-dependent protein
MGLGRETTATYPTPVGSFKPFGGTTAPTGWLLCDGSAVSRTTYANLFAVLGTSYGAGDGSTTFNLPDTRGRTIVGKNSATFAVLGATGGAETVVADLASHTHTGPSHTHTVSGTTGSDTSDHVHAGTTDSGGPSGATILTFTTLDVTSGGASARVNSITEGSTSHTHTYTTGGRSSNHNHNFSATSNPAGTGVTGSAGTGGGHSNLQPYQVANHIVKY